MKGWLVVSLAVVVVGTAVGAAGGGRAAPGEPEVVGGSHVQRALAARLAARFPAGTFERIAIGDPAELWPLSEGEAWAGDGGTGIQLWPTSRGPRGTWDAEMLATAFAVSSARSGLPPVGVAGIRGSATAGFDWEAAEAGPADAGARRALAADVRAAAEAAGAELLDVEVVAPLGLAFAATVRTGEPARFLQHGLESLLAVPDASEGWYVRVVDGAGEPVWQGSFAARTGAISHGSRDSALRGCGPIPWFPLEPEDAPPPCPVE